MNRQVLGRYELQRRLGVGSAASVYAATDVSSADRGPGREVAVKIFHQSANETSPWWKEMRLNFRLDSSHVASCLDFGFDYELEAWILVFELAEGGSLRRSLVAEMAFREDEVRLLLVQIAEALEHAHSQSILHCDIKPENVVAAKRQGATESTWLLTDFGAGAFLDEDGRAKTISGSIEYVAPEAFGGYQTPLSDQYSLGVMGLEMLDGVRPEPEVRARFIGEHRGAPGLRPALARMLEPNPEERFAHMAWARMALSSGDDWDLTRAHDGGPWFLASGNVYSKAGRIPHVRRAKQFVSSRGDEVPIVSTPRHLVSIEDDGARTRFAAERAFRPIAARLDEGLVLVERDGILELASVDAPEPLAQAPAPEILCDPGPPIPRLRGVFVTPELALAGRVGSAFIFHVHRRGRTIEVTSGDIQGPLVGFRREDNQVFIECARGQQLVEVRGVRNA